MINETAHKALDLALLRCEPEDFKTLRGEFEDALKGELHDEPEVNWRPNERLAAVYAALLQFIKE
jgi:hypothetical protein